MTRGRPGVTCCAGGHGGRETPGPIPNPEVKPSSADGTARGSVWESRKPPDHTPSPAGTREPHQGPPPPAGDNHLTTTPDSAHRHQTPRHDTKTHHHAVPVEDRRVLIDDEEPVWTACGSWAWMSTCDATPDGAGACPWSRPRHVEGPDPACLLDMTDAKCFNEAYSRRLRMTL